MLKLRDHTGDSLTLIKNFISDEFHVPKSELNELKFHVVMSDSDGYGASAFYIFEREGKLYEVNASHCSCYGFEDQWVPEETTFEYLLSDKCPYGYVEDETIKKIKAYFKRLQKRKA